MEKIIERPRFSPSKEIEYYYSHDNNIFENNVENITMKYNKEHDKIILLLSPNFVILFSIIITCSFAYFIKYISLQFP